jgi:hypothetical protein
MTASFPTSVKSFVPEVDLVSTVVADNVNSLQAEITAIEQALGTAATNQSPLISTYSGTFARTTGWSTIADRLNNIEYGLVNGVSNSSYVGISGGSVITTAANKGLVLQVGSGSANLFETYTSSAVLGFNINASGIPLVGSSNVLYVGSSDYASLVAANTANTTLANAKVPLSTITAAGDLIVGSGAGAVSRLGIGSAGQSIITNGTTVSWGIPTDTTKVPLATVSAAGDLIVGTGASAVSRLGAGSAGQVLTSNGSSLSWQTPTVYLSTANAAVSAASTGSGVIRNVWMSTSTPTGSQGAVGDIWVVYS